MIPLADGWPTLRDQIHVAPSVALFLDYDGTLVPIASHPSRAVLPEKTKRLLARVAQQPQLRVVIVSGRALSDVKRMVGVDGISYVGNHGLELEEHPQRYLHAMAHANRPILKRVIRDLRAVQRQVPGAWVEDKQWTLSLHWRGVPESDRGRLQRLAARVMAPYRQQEQVRLTSGKRVIEVRPPIRWGKGEMVRWLYQRMRAATHAPPPLLIYLGDDETDEEAFRAVNAYDGVSIVVGSAPHTSAGRWWLRRPSDVHRLLTRLLRTRCQKP